MVCPSKLKGTADSHIHVLHASDAVSIIMKLDVFFTALISERMYAGRYFTEVVKLLADAETNDGICGIGGLEPDAVFVLTIRLNGKVVIRAYF